VDAPQQSVKSLPSLRTVSRFSVGLILSLFTVLTELPSSETCNIKNDEESERNKTPENKMVIKNRKAGRKPQTFQDWGIKLHRGERNFNKLKVVAALGLGGGGEVMYAKAQSVCPLCLWYTAIQISFWTQKSDLLLMCPNMQGRKVRLQLRPSVAIR
jgi:hypothetical protein